MVSYQELESCDEVPSLIQDGNWYLTAWGMGDAVNAILFLESQSPVEYQILCPPRNFSAVKFILDNFCPGEPKCSHVCVYPLQDGYPISQDEVLMSCNGFGPHLINVAHTYNKLKVVHAPPKDWWRFQSLHTTGILNKILEYERNSPKVEDKTCILFPERGDSFQFPDGFWNEIVDKLKEKDYKIYVNTTDKKDVYKNEKIFEGTEDLHKPNIADLFDFVVGHKNLLTIGQRSGIFDMLKYFECRQIIFWCDVDENNMPDPTRALYESGHFEDDIYTKNNIELKLSTYNPKVLDLII